MRVRPGSTRAPWVVGLTVAALAVTVLPARASTPTASVPAGGYPDAEVAVAAKDNTFRPKTVRIQPGTTVAWTNEGGNDHNILASRENQDFGGEFGVEARDFEPGDEYEFRFDTPGSFPYFCSLHGTRTAGMTGKVVVGDGSGPSAGSGGARGVRRGTIRVPDDVPTIQQAVDVAAPGALVLIAPGVYREAVTVTPEHRNVVIRGEDRATTILDGGFSEEPGEENGFKVLADGVAIENLTVRNFATNGVYWDGVDGYRGSYLTAIRNGDYGIYAFDSVNGQFDHSYASGSPDAGFYIGQCEQCNALIVDVEAEWNGLGYSGTNAGGNLVLARSSWHHNRAGIVPNSGSYEEDAPQRAMTVVGNHVYDNNNDATSAIEIAELAIGNGIVVFGGVDNVVTRNRVEDHDTAGIIVIAAPEKLLLPDAANAQNFDATGNRVTDNVVERSDLDLVLVSTIDDPADAGGNCFARNEFTTSSPADLETLAPCGRRASSEFEAEVASIAASFLGSKPPGADYTTVPLPDPPALPNMPRATTAKPRPATNEPSIRVRVAGVKLPAPSER